MENGKRLFETTAFVFLLVLVSATFSFAQHDHGGDSGAGGEKMFSVGDLHIMINIKPYPMERGKTSLFSVNIHDMKTMQNVSDVQVKVSVGMKGKTQDVSDIELTFAQDKEAFTAFFIPESSGEAEVTLQLQGGALTEKLSFAFSETIKEKQNFIDKMMDKGMEMHHKMHSNWMLLGLMGIAMLVGHNLVH